MKTLISKIIKNQRVIFTKKTLSFSFKVQKEKIEKRKKKRNFEKMILKYIYFLDFWKSYI